MTTTAETSAVSPEAPPSPAAPSSSRRGEWLLALVMVAALGYSGAQLVRLGVPRLQPEFRPAVTFLVPPEETGAAVADHWEVPPWSALADVDATGAPTAVAATESQAAPEPAPRDDAPDDRAARWRIRFGSDLTPLEYAQRLDALGIELGVPAGGGKLDYVSSLAAATPQRRQGGVAEERRLYLTWSAGGLPQADAEFLAKAGIVQQAVVLHFLPAALEEQLAALELAFASAQSAEIVETEFAIRPGSAGGFEMYVLSQKLRDQDAASGD